MIGPVGQKRACWSGLVLSIAPQSSIFRHWPERYHPSRIGKPLLYADILNAVRFASERQLKVIITTNDSLLSEKLIRALNSSGLSSTDISLQLFGSVRHTSSHAGMPFQE